MKLSGRGPNPKTQRLQENCEQQIITQSHHGSAVRDHGIDAGLDIQSARPGARSVMAIDLYICMYMYMYMSLCVCIDGGKERERERERERDRFVACCTYVCM